MKAENIQVCFDIFFLKVITSVKFNPRRFSNPGVFSKEEPMNHFHDVFSTLTLPHRHEDKNNLKTHHEKETYIRFKLFVL